MGRKISAQKHPLYFKMGAAPDSRADGTTAKSCETLELCEFYLEQSLQGLTDNCLLISRSGSIVFANDAAKNLLSPKGRIVGRKLCALLGDHRPAALVESVFSSGQPVFTDLVLTPPAKGWREEHDYMLSIVPLDLAPDRRLIRFAMKEKEKDKAAASAAVAGRGEEMALRLRNPLTVINGHIENIMEGAVSDMDSIHQSMRTMKRQTSVIERMLEGVG